MVWELMNTFINDRQLGANRYEIGYAYRRRTAMEGVWNYNWTTGTLKNWKFFVFYIRLSTFEHCDTDWK